MSNKPYKSISEVSDLLKLNKHVIRYWDTKFDGVSTRLGDRKRRFFNQKNIKKLQTLRKLLHTDGKSHHSLQMAKMIIEGNMIDKNSNLSNTQIQNKSNINKLISVSENLSELLKQTE